ncbi:MAG: hypothetical protein LBC97_05285 [Bifidobacteriaceae bacterium]|jgi:hypothetical protein|nr:hypothetical protein [Bifidobacteriaceae bacterium]
MSLFRRRTDPALRRKASPLPRIEGEPTGPNPPCLISVAPGGDDPAEVAINLPGPSTLGITPLDRRVYLVGDQGDGVQAFQVKAGFVEAGDGISAAQALCDGFVQRQLAAHPTVAAQAGFTRIIWMFMPGEDGFGAPDADVLDLLLGNDVAYQLYLAEE